MDTQSFVYVLKKTVQNQMFSWRVLLHLCAYVVVKYEIYRLGNVQSIVKTLGVSIFVHQLLTFGFLSEVDILG